MNKFFKKNFAKGKRDNVGWAFSPTIKLCWGGNPNLQKSSVGRIWKRSIKNFPCHHELAAPLVADVKEAYNGGGSQSISGSCHRQEYTDFNINKSNVGQVCTTYNNITLNTEERSIIVSCLRHYSPRRIAFTLAEVLITLGIIGVVAAMTLPTLIQNYKVKQTVTQLKKINSQLAQAYTLIREEEGGGMVNSETFEWDDDLLMEKFAKYLKFQKKCPGNVGECWENTMYKDVKGGDYSRYDGKGNTRASGILADGTFIMFNLRRAGITNSEGETEYINTTPADGIFAQIYADINGHKPPNQLGVDFFYWFLVGDRIFPGGVPSCGKYGCSPNDFVRNCLNANGYHCTAWIIYNENMDYLKCSDLSWNGKHKCK